ncbi:ATP synthase F1 subunit delta [Enterococcus sp. LJL120]
MKLDKFTVGKRYGKALFELATEQNAVEAIYQDLLELRKVYEILPDVGNILSDARLEPDEKRKIMDSLVNNFSGTIYNFLEVVYNYNRMNDLPLMIDEFERRYDEMQGVILGTVTTAVPLNDADKVKIETKIATILGYQKAELTAIVNPSILGGVVVEAEHKVIDGSIQTRLENIKNLLRK